MYNALEFLDKLDDKYIDWIFNNGVEQRVQANTTLIKENSRIDHIYLLLEGVLGVYSDSEIKKKIATLGPGEIIGEMSFLDNHNTSAMVVAEEDTLLLAVPKETIFQKMESDKDFGYCFYRALAVTLSQRLRQSVSHFGSFKEIGENIEVIENPALKKLLLAFSELKTLIVKADEDALKNDNNVPELLADEVCVKFRESCLLFNQLTNGDSMLSEDVKNAVGYRIKQEILPYILLAHNAERSYSKPRGYAGDFLTIEVLYKNQPKGSGRIGGLVDRCYLQEPGAKAVRNRRNLLVDEITKTLAAKNGDSAEITTLACGPAAEVFDVYENMDDKSKLKVNLVDFDLQALAFVSQKSERLRLQKQMRFLNENIIYLAIGREKLKVKDQDLVYSIGLIDYFSDKLVKKMLDFIYDILAPGGRVILGNFHPKNSSRALMDHVLDWRLIHRSEKDMDNLFLGSKFNKLCTNIRFEEEGINLFAECVK